MEREVCCIVGMGPGLSSALARRFGREGFAVAMLARSAAALKDFRKELAAAGIEAHAIPADAGSLESLENAFRLLHKRVGEPDVLIYNAAVLQGTRPTELLPEVLARDLRVNVVGALASVQHVLGGMRARGRGTILLTGGGLALDPVAAYASLAVGKAGVRSLALTLAEELEPQGIHVATVTIRGFIKPGTHFDPDRIADAYWELHRQDPGSWERERVYE